MKGFGIFGFEERVNYIKMGLNAEISQASLISRIE